GGEILMIADPSLFRVLPWAANTAWVLCDLHAGDGKPVPDAPRQIYRDALSRLSTAGFDFVAGFEIEFHLFRLTCSGVSDVCPVSKGQQSFWETRFDEIDASFEAVRRGVLALGLPLRTMAIGAGPGQCKVTLAPLPGLAAADAAALFRSAVRQIARRNG